MFDSRREKVLLATTLSLLAILIVGQLIIAPLWSYVSDLSDDITDLRLEIAKAEMLQKNGTEVQLPYEVVDSRIRLANEQGQSEFRRYLESTASPGGVKSSAQKGSAVEMSNLGDLRLITYELKLIDPLESLRAFLENLDRSQELLRIDSLLVTNSDLEDADVNMTLTISTIARHAEGS